MIVLPGDLLAYIDPSTGAIVLQVLAATVLTAGVLFRQAFVLPLNSLRRLLGRPEATDPEAQRESD